MKMKFVKNPELNPDWSEVEDYLVDLLLISKEKLLSKLYIYDNVALNSKIFKACLNLFL